MSKIKDLANQTFGYLKYLSEDGHSVTKSGNKRRVLCECVCGKIISIIASNLTKTKEPQKSCGCKQKIWKTHGLTNHPLYGVYHNIKNRCYNEKFKFYKNYGGAGVAMCEEWRNDFKAFYDWCIENGWERGLEIDKDLKSPTKPGKIYSPEFCSFVTQKDNCNGRSFCKYFEYNGKMLTLTQIAELLGIQQETLFARIFYRKMSFDQAIIIEDKRKHSKGNRKLNDKDVLEIFHSKDSIQILERKFNVRQQTIKHIKTKKTWKHLTENL